MITGFFSFAQSGTTVRDSIVSGGVFRAYNLYIPSSYNGTKPVPLLINLHGLASNATQQQVYGNFMSIADTANFIIVHPEGFNSGGTQFWNVGLFPTPDDLMFMRRLIDSLDAAFNIDNEQVYSCGLSNGAILSYYMACNLPDKITAIASVAGTMFRSWYYNCIPNRPTPVMEIHGTEDTTVPYEGNGSASSGALYQAVDTIIAKWVGHNRCNPSPLVQPVADVNVFDGSTAIHYTYSGGADESSVELFKVIGGSHSWPGAINVIYKTNQDFNASAEIWRFFRKFRLSQFKAPVGLDENEITNTVAFYPNPVNEQVVVPGSEGQEFKLYSTDGKLVLKGISNGKVSLVLLEPGIYFMQVQVHYQPVSLKILKN